MGGAKLSQKQERLMATELLPQLQLWFGLMRHHPHAMCMHHAQRTAAERASTSAVCQQPAAAGSGSTQRLVLEHVLPSVPRLPAVR